MNDAQKLARRILEWDKAYPGDDDSAMELTAEEWAKLVEPARRILPERKDRKRERATAAKG